MKAHIQRFTSIFMIIVTLHIMFVVFDTLKTHQIIMYDKHNYLETSNLTWVSLFQSKIINKNSRRKIRSMQQNFNYWKLQLRIVTYYMGIFILKYNKI